MDDVGTRQNRAPVNHMAALSWIQMRYDEIYLVNERCVGQQLLRATCVAADALRSLTGIKPIQRLHGGFSLGFHIVEELHVTAFDLKILVKLCNVKQKTRHASSSSRNELGCAPVFKHAWFHTSTTHWSCVRDDGNASTQLSQHRYRDRAVRWISSNPKQSQVRVYRTVSAKRNRPASNNVPGS